MRRFSQSILAGAILVLGSMPAAMATNATIDIGEVYAPYGKLVERFLEERNVPKDGLVSAFDYRAALADPETAALLQRQDARLAEFDIDRIDTREEANAFWLNAYNYFMIAYILRNPENGELIESVRDYGSWFNPYRVFGRDVFDIGGENYSLDQIEKDILLGDEYLEKGWFEARVHFAVNCASVGCPPLRSTLYTTDNVDDLLTENTRKALNTPRHLHLDGDTLHLTQLFEWYEEDYEHEAASVRDWIRQHADADVRAKVDSADSISYIDYDWTLNAPEYFPEFEG